MEFSPFVLFTDFGFIAILLMVGVILRAKVSFIQRLFIPASIIAGTLGLIFGPHVLKMIPFSEQLATYPALFITIVFGTIPLTSSSIEWRYMKGRIGSKWAYFQ